MARWKRLAVGLPTGSVGFLNQSGDAIGHDLVLDGLAFFELFLFLSQQHFERLDFLLLHAVGLIKLFLDQLGDLLDDLFLAILVLGGLVLREQTTDAHRNGWLGRRI